MEMTQEARDEQKKEMLDDLIEDNIAKLSLGGSIYEYAFWLMYHEDSPAVLRELMVKCCFSVMTTLILTTYYLEARGKVVEDHIHYGSTNLNIVRTICILMLHLQMYPNARDSRAML